MLIVIRTALIGENSVEYVETLIEIWNEGNCAVLLDWRIPCRASIEIMIEAGVQLCYVQEKYYEAFFRINCSISFVSFKAATANVVFLPTYIYDKYINRYCDDEAVIIYSSGTTGKARGIILSHYAINTNADAIIDYMKPTTEDCIYIAKTISHSSTLTGELLVALKARAKLVIAPTIVPPRYIFKNIYKFGVTIICLNPSLLSMLTDEYERAPYNIFSLKSIYVSGSILNDRLYNKAHAVFYNIPIYNVYGLSEAGPRVSAQRADCCKSNSVGKPIKNVEIKLVNEQGCAVSDGEYGIIHINTPSLFDGYVTGQPNHVSLCKGWQNTGDIGYTDANGELHIINRMDDVIIIDSHKVYPSEVEKQIAEQSNVKMCAVVAAEFNNKEVICCLYVSEKDSEKDIRERLKSKLLPYEIPKLFLRCDTLPQTLTNKISNNEIKKLLNKTFNYKN